MRVLIALDDHRTSQDAARIAVRLFRATGATFFVINVAPIATPWVGDATFGAVSSLSFDLRWLNDDLTVGEPTRMHDLMSDAASVGVPDPVPIVKSGDPVDCICSAAEELDVDVVVVGSHPRTALRRLFDPSVADGVAHRTTRPVLLVGEEESADDGGFVT